ncbi:hypothetical protein Ahy_A09g042306 isoform C [Arachis hypogaea]|uniref:Uncharacterized protein n=1 Tax=Arachis hypogaea TaxID=3818 RepID=A0A445BFF6_ARAHY|nr:hypothetical protein Ahy_A09g042306 isoform C [Arachis hypogaea]
MREIGISIPKIYESFVAQLGGFNLVTFTKQDMYNEIRKQRGFQGGDVSATIRYLEGKAPQSVITDGDPTMRIAIQSVFPNAHHRCVLGIC